MPDEPVPPWRRIDTDDDGRRDHGVPASAAPTRGAVDSPMLRVGLAVSGAVVLAVAGFILAMGSGDGGGVTIDVAGATSDDPSALASGPAAEGATLVVEVAGAVADPGVFRVPAGSRVGELIALAGGYGPRVDAARVDAELNLAATVSDGERIRVPSRDDSSARPASSAATGGTAGDGSAPALIDLNTATAEQLDTLPGIGPVTAEKIIAAREEAPFVHMDELRSRGILGEKTFEQVRPLVTVP